jgi:two-component system LytT family response regulator
MIRIGIVDDEENARRIIVKYLERYCEEKYSIVFESTSYQETIDAIIKFKPDVLYLDINLLDGSGIDIAQYLKDINISTKIIFTTAYNEYAIIALKLKAFDYILKPIDSDEFKDSLSNIILELKDRNDQTTIPLKISVSTLSGISLIDLNSIEYVKADASYCTIQITNDKPLTISKPLKHIENQIEKNPIFIKIHKSYLVNRNFVKSLDRATNEIVLIDGARLPISRNNLKMVFNFFKKK